MKVAFVIDVFPRISETFIIDQACDLIDRGIDVYIYALNRGNNDKNNISKRYFDYDLENRTSYLNAHNNKFSRILSILPRFLELLFLKPSSVPKLLSSLKYFKLLSWNLRPLLNNRHDIYHCHFGTVGAQFVMIRKVLGIKEKFITTFYGQDASMAIKRYGVGMYRELIKESSKFFVMSEDMRQRLVANGFPYDQIKVHPIGIDVEKYSYTERKIDLGGQVNIVSVGRFVEKKGFEDLIRALAIVKEKGARKFKCYIVGDGPLRERISSLVKSLKVDDVIEFMGFMSIDKILNLFKDMHFFIQPSKTAKDGDME
ncbi:MAG: glycosyltransferase [Candidatus Yanofskybacteria bacterium]|nr:glycosyltransferase [Candidatus Yanofskybacteria bacterium]